MTQKKPRFLNPPPSEPHDEQQDRFTDAVRHLRNVARRYSAQEDEEGELLRLLSVSLLNMIDAEAKFSSNHRSLALKIADDVILKCQEIEQYEAEAEARRLRAQVLIQQHTTWFNDHSTSKYGSFPSAPRGMCARAKAWLAGQ